MKLPAAQTGRVLALDLATVTGWASGNLAEASPSLGAIELRGDEPVKKAASLRNWVEDHERIGGKLTALVVEAPLLTGQRSMHAAELAMALFWPLKLWAYDASIPFYAVPSQTARKAVIGRGTFPAGTAKEHVLAWCRTLGFHLRSHDAADALILWLAVRGASMPRPAAA